MGWHLHPPLAAILGNYGVHVDGQAAVGVNSHAEEARVGLKWGQEKIYSLMLKATKRIFLNVFIPRT